MHKHEIIKFLKFGILTTWYQSHYIMMNVAYVALVYRMASGRCVQFCHSWRHFIKLLKTWTVVKSIEKQMGHLKKK